MQDKRRDGRVKAQVRVSLEASHNFYAGITGDVSYGGVFIVTDDPPAPQSEVKVLITLPDGHVVRATGSVRWVRTRDFQGRAGFHWTGDHGRHGVLPGFTDPCRGPFAADFGVPAGAVWALPGDGGWVFWEEAG